MRTSWVAFVIICIFGSQAAMAADDGQTQPKVNMAANNSSSTPTNLIPSTNGSGNVKGVLCVLDQSFSGDFASPLVKFYVNGGAAQSVTLDSGVAEVYELSGSVFGSTGWVPFNVRFTSSIRVTIQKASSGGGTIVCQASWGLD